MNRIHSHQSPSVLDVRDPYSQFYQGPHHGKHWYLWHPDDIGTAKPMNEVEWFKAFQPLLLRVINTGYGRQLMGINPVLPPIQGITKNAIHYYLGEGQWQSEFHVGAKWANVIRYRWNEFKRYARFFYDMPHFFTLLNINGRMVPAHATTTAYPDPHVESTSVDGYGYPNESSWENSRANAVADSYTSDSDDNMYACGNLFTVRLCRGWTLFDTSGINDTHSVSAAICSLDVHEKDQETAGSGVCLTGGSPASNTAIVEGDFDGMTSLNSPTEFMSRVNLGSIGTSSAYHDFTLDSDGRSAISLDGITKFMWRLSDDVTNTDSGNEWDYIRCRSADYTGTSSDPKLVVTHGPPTNIEKINGIAFADIEKVNGITSANGEEINTIDF